VIGVAGITTFVVSPSDDDAAPPSTAGPTCRATVAEATAAPASGDVAPAFALPGLDGGCVRLDDLRGRPVIINFWASWCSPCRDEFPLLRAAYEDHAESDGLEVIGITYRDIPFDSRRFAEEEGADWALAIDDDQRAAQTYRVTAIPQTLFVRRDGTISARIYGPFSTRELDAALREILREDA